MEQKYKEFSELLLGSRVNLKTACEEFGIPLIDEKEINMLQCVNCNIWVKRNKAIDEMCSFCADLDTLRF